MKSRTIHGGHGGQLKKISHIHTYFVSKTTNNDNTRDNVSNKSYMDLQGEYNYTKQGEES